MPKTAIQPADMAAPTAPYSLGIKTGDLVFVSGQVAVDAAGNVAGIGDPVAQTRQVMENLKSVLATAGATLADVVKITIFLTDMAYLPQILEVRKSYFAPPYPASTAVQVVALANKDWLVEIEATAVIGAGR